MSADPSYVTGNIERVRITKGAARYKGPFDREAALHECRNNAHRAMEYASRVSWRVMEKGDNRAANVWSAVLRRRRATRDFYAAKHRDAVAASNAPWVVA